MASNSGQGVLGKIISISVGFVVLGIIISWFQSGAHDAESFSDGIIMWLDTLLTLGQKIGDLILSRMPQG